MTFPTIFNNIAAGNEPLSLFDTMFNVVASMGVVMCTATGTNTLVLTPVTNMPTVAAYTNYQLFGFVAPATSTGNVTINVSTVGAVNAYNANGTTQITTGDLISGAYYIFAYNSALNGAAGGFQSVGSSAAGIFSRLLVTAASGQNANLTLNSTSLQSSITLQDAGATKWFVSKQAGNDFIIYDGVNGKTAFHAVLGGNVSLGQADNVIIDNTGLSTFPVGLTFNASDTTLKNYKEGTWAPTDGSGAGLSFGINYAAYTRVGRIVFVSAQITFPTTANASGIVISGLPFTVASSGYFPTTIESGSTRQAVLSFRAGTTNAWVMIYPGDTNVANSDFSAKALIFSGYYFI